MCSFSFADTSRPKRDNEIDGREYYFVPRNVFEQDILENKFVEYGEYEKHFFGTSMESIRQVVNSGKICILNFHPQVRRIKVKSPRMCVCMYLHIRISVVPLSMSQRR